MKKIVNLTLATILGIVVVTTTISADVAKGQQIYTKQLKAKCGKTGGAFASRHSQNEWENIYDAGKLSKEIKKICNGHTLNEKLLPHIYDFAYEYANDSGNIPKP